MSTVGQFLLKKDMNAALAAFGCIMLSLVGIPGEILAAVIISFVTLQKGMKSGALVVAFVALPAVGFLLHREASLFDLGFLQCLFVWLFAGLLRKYQSWRIVFETMVIGSIACVGLMHLIMANPAQYWTDLLVNFVTALNASVGGKIDMPQMTTYIRAIAPYLTGLLMFSAASMMFVQLLLAQLWQYRLAEQRGKLYDAFIQIRVGYLNAGILTLAMFGMLFHVAFARDCLFAILLPFVVGGLSYLHYTAKRYRPMLVVLGLIYVGLVMSSFGLTIVIVLSLIGYIDSLFNFRKRFAF
ncbi:MAG: hypothetical protein COB66_03215 [Coxiella sp. (in: Bacteria)]|nr:MAG: hypothetical protein COB66_03215 [Coxiella sp. (in: g-proteobacteria)]